MGRVDSAAELTDCNSHKIDGTTASQHCKCSQYLPVPGTQALASDKEESKLHTDLLKYKLLESCGGVPLQPV